MALADNAGCAKPGGGGGGDLLFPEIIELNVGGQVYITRRSTLASVPGSLLWDMFTGQRAAAGALARDSKGRFFVDRDGFLFRYILDYMRDQQLILPEHFPERGRLQREAEFFRLPEMVKALAPKKISQQNSLGEEPGWCQSDPEELSPSLDTAARTLAGGPTPTGPAATAGAASSAPSPSPPGGPELLRRSGFITLGYRGSYTLGRESQADAKFRRVARIMVCGKTALAKEVFGETLNESRDPDRPPERYTSRYYLKFTFLEQAFDKLADAGFHMVACNSTGTCAYAHEQTDDKIWTSYTEYVFYRPLMGSQNLEEGPGDPSFPGVGGGIWLSVATPTQGELEQNVARKHLASSSEPILDLKTDAAAMLLVDGASMSTTEITPLTAMECAPVSAVEQDPIMTPLTPQDPAQSPQEVKEDSSMDKIFHPSSDAEYCDSEMPPPSPPPSPPPPPEKGSPSEAGSSGSLPWPEVPEECGPPRPTTLELPRSPKNLEEVKPKRQKKSINHANVNENGLESCPEAPSDERRAIQSELGKCIEDFRKIKIPVTFPNKKRQWQQELLKKYQL